MGTKGRGLYIAGALGLGALLGAGCVGGVKVDPAEPVKDESLMYRVESKGSKDYMKGLKESGEPVKGIKGIESYIEGLTKDKAPMKGLTGIESYIKGPEKTLDFDPFDNTGDKDNKFHPWLR